MKRVVITGLGIITPGADNIDTLWNRVLERKPYIARVQELEIAHYFLKKEGVAVGAKFSDIRLEEYMDCNRLEERYDTTTKIALIASEQAITDSKLSHLQEDTAVIIGSARGNTSSLERKIIEVADCVNGKVPLKKAEHIRGASLTSSSSIAAAVSRHYKLNGMSRSISTACTSSLNAIGDAYKQVKFGESELVLAGGAEAALTLPLYIWFNLAGIYTPAAEIVEASVRPFCKTRQGTALGEMACMLLLEEKTHALERGARIYGEVLSFADTIDPSPKSFEALSEDGMPYGNVVKRVVSAANIDPENIDLVIAHGTGTKSNDEIELRALDQLYTNNRHPLTFSLKGITGHGVGACAALEIAVGLYAMDKSMIPPCANIIEVDEFSPRQNISIDITQRPIKYLLKMGSGFGGYMSSLLLKKGCD